MKRRALRPGRKRPPLPVPVKPGHSAAASGTERLPSVNRPKVLPADLDPDFGALLEYMDQQSIPLAPEAISGIRAYGELVVERSGVLNLVAQADRPRIFTRHIIECLAAPLLARARQASLMVDIGSGAGLPGIPVALGCPALEVILVEPRLRKAQFLESAASALGLARRVSVFHGTAEAFGRRRGEPRADLVTARAVDRLHTIWAWTRPLIRPGGWLALFKGRAELDAELALVEAPGPRAVEVHEIPGRPRVLVLLQAD